jgi:uncharacterized protein (TIGR02145 family)
MSRLLYIPRKILASLGYGCLYNWWCTQEQHKEVLFGYLYNGHAAIDSRQITANGWHVCTYYDLISDLGSFTEGDQGKLIDSNLNYWESLSNVTNLFGFNCRGGGMRSYDNGAFVDLKVRCFIKCVSDGSPTYSGVISTGGYTGIAVSGRDMKDGNTIRLVKDSTTLINGQTGIYIGNDGKVYPTVCIRNKEWLAADLMETKYRNGDLIPEVTVNASWAGLTSGGRCSYGNLESNAGTTKSISPVGWHVPSNPEFGTLRSYLDPAGSVQSNIAGGKLKEVGFIYWNSPNTGATNEAGFNAKGAGNRPSTFSGLGQHGHFHSTYVSFNGNPGSALLFYNNAQFWAGGTMSGSSLKSGSSIRLIKDTSDWVEGETVTDSEGNIYPTVKIGTQVWVASNWKCKQWSDGSTIPNVTDNATWGALTTPAWCYPGNDPLNA